MLKSRVAKCNNRSFLLMEVMIAFTLVAISAPFLMRLPILHYRKQIERLTAFEQQRLADWTFSEIKELLLQQKIHWAQLPEKDNSMTRLLPEVTLRIPNLPPKNLQRSFSLKCVREKEGNHEQIYRLYEVRVWFDNNQKKFFKYKVCFQRLPLPKDNDLTKLDK